MCWDCVSFGSLIFLLSLSLQYLNAIDLFRGVLELSTIVFLAFFLRQEIDEAIQTKRARGNVLYYFEDGWNYLDLLNLGLLWTVGK